MFHTLRTNYLLALHQIIQYGMACYAMNLYVAKNHGKIT